MTARVIRKEKQMSEAVSRFLGQKSTREMRVGGGIFDVVAYDFRRGLFKVVECKLATSPRSIGRTFGQICAYYAVLTALGRNFIGVFTEKVHLNYEMMMQATKQGRQLKVAFYVALTNDGCRQRELIRSIKTLLPDVGIIRVRPDGKCRDHLNCKDGEKLAEATPIKIKILQA